LVIKLISVINSLFGLFFADLNKTEGFLCFFFILPPWGAVLSPPRPPALQGGFNAVVLTRSDCAGNGAVCRK
ncbi:hypothetical protein, partial [Escherichia coli]|uniref:hypothetical protein n=1 Tax=Escherichia coli TaxID=562 RepID=UPI000CD52C90